MDMLIGGTAGAVATIFSNPFDVVKTRMMLQGEMVSWDRQVTRYRNVPHAAYVIARADGVRALYRGLPLAMLYGFVMNGIRLGIYKTLENHGWLAVDGAPSALRALVAGCGSGAAGAALATPLNLVKTRLQAAAHPDIAVGRQHLYKGVWDAFRQIVRTEGAVGLAAGARVAGARLAVGSAAQLSTFSKSKEYFSQWSWLQRRPALLVLAASGVSGAVVAVSVCPLDVAAVRIYNQGKCEPGQCQYHSMTDCLRKIYRFEGLHGLYKGLGPLYLRVAPHSTVSLLVWEMLNNSYDKYKEARVRAETKKP